MTTSEVNAVATRRIAITGATGLIGSQIVRQLEEAGDQTIQLTRRPPTSTVTQAQWSVEDGLVNPSRLEGAYGVIHLAGESIVGRWTEDKKRRIRDSRVRGTRRLCEDLAALSDRPKVLVCASATGFYGDRGDEILDEGSAAGEGFLAGVCKEWEAATAPAAEAGIRVVNVRTGVVIAREGGALPNMLTPFKVGVGGKIGSGRQYWSWISLDDVVGAFVKGLNDEQIAGPLNATSPHPVTNAEFTRVLGEVLHRPTVLPLPGFAAKLVLGQMAEDLLLASARVLPRVLETQGYTFAYPELRACLEHELHGKKSS
jgi:uncharacterized protein